MDKKPCSSQEVEVRKGPWTMEEDLILINYITNHGEGVWNSLAKAAGLKRTGKSCRLRWLNYLRPDVRRGNITPEEQLLIMELQAKWGNRWSKIAKHLPGRTDNEIKNYWRTKIQKHVKHTDNYPTDAINSELGEHHHASSSQMMEDIGSDHQHYQYHHAIESYTPGAIMYSNNNFEAMHPSGGVGEGPSASSVISSSPMPAYHPSSDNLWTMEDVWPMHLLNNVD